MIRRIRALTGSSTRVATAIAFFCISYPLMALGAFVPNAWLFLVAGAVSYLSEPYLKRVRPYFLNRLSVIHVGVTIRFLLRDMLLLVLLVRSGELGTTATVLVGFGLLGLHGARAAHTALVEFTKRRRRLPVVTRNIDLSALNIPGPPPRWLVRNGVRNMSHLDVAPMLFGVSGVVTSAYVPLAVALVCSLTIGAAAVLTLLRFAWQLRRVPPGDVVLRHVNQQLRSAAPEVLLYFSGSRDSAYQINMWLSTLANLDRPSCIIMRERELVPLLGKTSKPVVCIPSAIHLMDFELPSARIALYTANVGKNIHLLRVPGIKHVFIGHGDSDKIASVNPFAKVYDELWVAGKGGRDRWAKADVGVRLDAIKEVGRPQLDPIQTAITGTPDGIFTVLYAPTWEGWTADPFHTSLVRMGPKIVRKLLDHSPAIRVLYKPHPLTGVRDPAARAADEAIVGLIDKTNERQRDEDDESTPEMVEERQAAAPRLLVLQSRLGNLTNVDDDRDAVTISESSYRPGEDIEAAAQQLKDEWNRCYWKSRPWRDHRVIKDAMPTLYDCFNRTDVLISDISSVVADFVQSQKPYVVTNGPALSEQEFRSSFPTASAAYLLSPDCSELPDIMAAVMARGEDAMAERRRALKTYLLGSDKPDSMTRFNEAISRLVDQSTGQSPLAPAELEFGFDPEPTLEPAHLLDTEDATGRGLEHRGEDENAHHRSRRDITDATTA